MPRSHATRSEVWTLFYRVRRMSDSQMKLANSQYRSYSSQNAGCANNMRMTLAVHDTSFKPFLWSFHAPSCLAIALSVLHHANIVLSLNLASERRDVKGCHSTGSVLPGIVPP